jgi:hypothetical protein
LGKLSGTLSSEKSWQHINDLFISFNDQPTNAALLLSCDTMFSKFGAGNDNMFATENLEEIISDEKAKEETQITLIPNVHAPGPKQ